MISVIVPTARPNMESMLLEQLNKQTFKNFELIVVDTLYDSRKLLSKDYVIKHLKSADKDKGDVWTLNKDYNLALKEAKGELLVFLQDFIWIPANGLQRFWEVYQLYPDALITGCGHKYEEDLKTINEIDERCIGEKRCEECSWTYFELNWGSCHRNIMPRFDEEMDKKYGGENLYISHKANKKVYLDRMNECKGLSQEICGGRPEDWELRHINKG